MGVAIALAVHGCVRNATSVLQLHPFLFLSAWSPNCGAHAQSRSLLCCCCPGSKHCCPPAHFQGPELKLCNQLEQFLMHCIGLSIETPWSAFKPCSQPREAGPDLPSEEHFEHAIH